VSNGDLQRLNPGQWLNDEVINYFGSLIMQRSGSEPASNKENQTKTKGPAGANEQKSTASTSVSTSMSTSQDVKGKGKALPTANESEQPSSSKGTGLDVYVYSSFFYSKLLESDCYQRGKIFKWTKDVSRYAYVYRIVLISEQVNIFEKDIALLPINRGNTHWTTAAINFQLKRFEYYDSMGLKDPVVFKVYSPFAVVESISNPQ
jgi:sentrin-specific protease 1